MQRHACGEPKTPVPETIASLSSSQCDAPERVQRWHTHIDHYRDTQKGGPGSANLCDIEGLLKKYLDFSAAEKLSWVGGNGHDEDSFILQIVSPMHVTALLWSFLILLVALGLLLSGVLNTAQTSNVLETCKDTLQCKDVPFVSCQDCPRECREVLSPESFDLRWRAMFQSVLTRSNGWIPYPEQSDTGEYVWKQFTKELTNPMPITEAMHTYVAAPSQDVLANTRRGNVWKNDKVGAARVSRDLDIREADKCKVEKCGEPSGTPLHCQHTCWEWRQKQVMNGSRAALDSIPPVTMTVSVVKFNPGGCKFNSVTAYSIFPAFWRCGEASYHEEGISFQGHHRNLTLKASDAGRCRLHSWVFDRVRVRRMGC
jgi:hypothetical protein